MSVDTEELVAELLPDLKARLKERMLSAYSYEIDDAVKTEVRRYIAEDVMPEVREALQEQHAEIVASFVTAIVGVHAEMGAAMVKGAKEKLTSYSGDKLVAKLMREVFGSGY